MQKRLAILFRFFRYYWNAKTRYNIHSPFVFDFVEKIVEDRRWFYAFDGVEGLRKWLLSRKETVELTDFGAGSQVATKKVRSIKSIAKHSATSPYYCRTLFRLINHYKPKTLLELGTSLGVSSLYQAAAALDSRFVTIEGDPAVAALAAKNFKQANAGNIQLVNGEFDKVLPKVLADIKKLDYVFIDGNHRKEPTIKYFEDCLKYAHKDSIFVFDDIHWSSGMEAAWEEIKQHPKVTVTVDLFFYGIVFFREEQTTKEHYEVIRANWKPTVMGFLK